ncbi:MAG TPA: DUF3313 domain-containing protein [Thermoanaerobaculia bacterium]
MQPSDFLGDAGKLLQKGDKTDFLMVYRNRDARWSEYDKILLEPVAIWHVENSRLPKDALADLQKLVDDFQRLLMDKLSRDYKMVDAPGPNTMRIRIAIMNGERANVPLKVASHAPYAGYANTVWTFVTGKPAFAGEVSLEYMVRDSVSDALLAAGADRRVGGNQVDTSTLSSWGDVQKILTYWTDEAVYRLCLDRKAQECPRPKAGLLENPVF